jgi:3-hydroxybutyryl-CoA dehydrogenase
VTGVTGGSVAVVGAGPMGTGIAYALVAAGCSVMLVDTADEALNNARASIDALLAEGVKRGKLAAAQVAQAQSALTTASELSRAIENHPVALLIETATESLPIKIKIAREADRLLPREALLATNTSALSVTEIAAATTRPERVVGMHFFNPVHKMRLVEIVRGLATSAETLQLAREWVALIGKKSVCVEDSPGLMTSRLSALLGNEAMYMLMEGIASAEDIDAAARGAFNHPMGPLELGDLTGWDTRLAALKYLHETLGEKFRPCPLINKLVKAGRLGIKSGQGVYKYVNGERLPKSDSKI